jgi:hypothetical protein
MFQRIKRKLTHYQQLAKAFLSMMGISDSLPEHVTDPKDLCRKDGIDLIVILQCEGSRFDGINGIPQLPIIVLHPVFHRRSRLE